MTQDKGLFPGTGERTGFSLIMIFILSDISYALDTFCALLPTLKTTLKTSHFLCITANPQNKSQFINGVERAQETYEVIIFMFIILRKDHYTMEGGPGFEPRPLRSVSSTFLLPRLRSFPVKPTAGGTARLGG